jgi:hypothetical protein
MSAGFDKSDVEQVLLPGDCLPALPAFLFTRFNPKDTPVTPWHLVPPVPLKRTDPYPQHSKASQHFQVIKFSQIISIFKFKSIIFKVKSNIFKVVKVKSIFSKSSQEFRGLVQWSE